MIYYKSILFIRIVLKKIIINKYEKEFNNLIKHNINNNCCITNI